MKQEQLMLVEKFFVKYFRSILMSRVGQAIINIPDGVEVKKVNNKFLVKGSKGELTALIGENIDVNVKDKVIHVVPKDKSKRHAGAEDAVWGLEGDAGDLAPPEVGSGLCL